MKRIGKYLLGISLTVFLFLIGYAFYIGNYLYDYTLNSESTHNISEKIEKKEEKLEKAREWLELNSEVVSMKSDDGLNLKAHYIDQKSDIYLIMIHGYRGDGASIISPIKEMKKQGYNLLIPDLRGHGLSEGKYIGMGWDDRLDVMKWIEMIISKNKDASVVLYGVSMGGATVMNAAGEKLPQQVKAVIEDCGYTSVWDVFKDQIDLNEFESRLALNIGSLLTRVRAGYSLKDVKPINQVKRSCVPILFIHGGRDKFVPTYMVDELYNAAKCEKEKLIIDGAGHANSCAVNPKLYYETMLAFIKKYTLTESL